MAAAFVLTTQSPTVLIIRHPVNIWATDDLVMTATPIVGVVRVVTRIGIPIVIATTVVEEDGMIETEIGIPMDATAVTGVTDAALRQAVAVEDIRLTTGVVGVTPEARLGEAVPPEVDGIMRLRQQQLRLQPTQMRLGGERLRRAWVKIKMR
jgi:hypothetical protein